VFISTQIIEFQTPWLTDFHLTLALLQHLPQARQYHHDN